MAAGALKARSDDGFTLVELMVVALIIVVLLGVAVVSYASASRSADAAVCRHNRQVLEEAARVNGCKLDGSPFLTLDDLAPFVADYENASRCPADGTGYLFHTSTLEVSCLNHED